MNLRGTIRRILKPFRGSGFIGSNKYWESRYKSGGNSGSGSYGRLALFKAQVINDFVKTNAITSVIEWGCGDGNQLTLATYPKYFGVDVSPTAIVLCKTLFQKDSSKQFFLYDRNLHAYRAQLALSLDVIYHLVEDEVFDKYMSDLFMSAEKFVIIYSSNEEGKQNFHERRRPFSNWIDEYARDWKLVREIPNAFPYDLNDTQNTSQSNFYIYQKIGELVN